MKPYLCACGCGVFIKPHKLDDRGHWSSAKYATQTCRGRILKKKAQSTNCRHQGFAYYDVPAPKTEGQRTIDRWLYSYPAKHGDGTRDYSLDQTGEPR